MGGWWVVQLNSTALDAAPWPICCLKSNCALSSKLAIFRKKGAKEKFFIFHHLFNKLFKKLFRQRHATMAQRRAGWFFSYQIWPILACFFRCCPGLCRFGVVFSKVYLIFEVTKGCHKKVQIEMCTKFSLVSKYITFNLKFRKNNGGWVGGG